MTEAQEQVIQRVLTQLGEHFTCAVVVVGDDVEHHRESVQLFWRGGFSSAVGLLKMGQDKISATYSS